MDGILAVCAAFGGGLVACKPLVQTATKFLDDLLGDSFKNLGGTLADRTYAWRTWNRVKILARAKELREQLREAEAPPSTLPPGFILPLLESAGNIDDPDLQELWAQLIASASSEKRHQHPAYRRILSDLSKDEALLLKEVAKGGFEFTLFFNYIEAERRHRPAVVEPADIEFQAKRKASGTLWLQKAPVSSEHAMQQGEEMLASVSRLESLGLVLPTISSRRIAFSGSKRKRHVKARLTAFGLRLLSACAPESVADSRTDETWMELGEIREAAYEAARQGITEDEVKKLIDGTVRVVDL